MRLIKFCLLFIFTLALLGMLNGNTPPTVTNVSAFQRTDGSKIVDIWYSVNDADNDTLTVSLVVSNDNGATFVITPSPANLSGAIGENIISGNNKHIVWNAGNEGIAFNGSQFRVKVTATEKINLSFGLVAYYPFNGNANDESGNGHDGVISNTASFTDRFNNPSSAFSFLNTASSMITGCNITNTKTLSFWMWSTRPATSEDGLGIGFLHQNGSGTQNSSFGLMYGANESLDWCFWGYCNDFAINSPDYIWSNSGEWWHIVLTMDDNNICNWYLNSEHKTNLYNWSSGGQVSSFTVGNTIPSFKIGYLGGGSACNTAFDDIRIYNRVLSPTEIQALYHEGGWTGNP